MAKRKKKDDDTEVLTEPRQVPSSLVETLRENLFKTSQGVRGSWVDHATETVRSVNKAVNEFSTHSEEQGGKRVSAKTAEETKATLTELKEFRKDLNQVANRPGAMIIAMRKRDQIKSTMPPRIEILLNKLMLEIVDEIIKEHDVQQSQENKDV